MPVYPVTVGLTYRPNPINFADNGNGREDKQGYCEFIEHTRIGDAVSFTSVKKEKRHT